MKAQIPESWYSDARQESDSWSDIYAEFDEQKDVRRSKRAIDAFHYLFVYLASKHHLRDEWLEPHCHIFPFSTGIIERSQKIKWCEFSLGVSLYGWFIEAPLAHAYQIRYVGDNFWRHIAHLSAIGTAKLESDTAGSSVVSDKAAKLEQHKSSLVYSIARNFTLAAIDPDSDDVSVGTIHLSFPIESAEPDVLRFFSEGLNALYRANYILYRAGYLRRKTMLRRTAKQNG